MDSDRGGERRRMEALVRRALEEDVGSGDVTTVWTVPEDRVGRARIIARAPLVVSGVAAAKAAFQAVEPALAVRTLARDGRQVEPGEQVLAVEGPMRGILTAERTALNLLGRLSGVATLTRRFVEQLAGTPARILDTRKTTPGLRWLEKAAVRDGGGMNHRSGLYDMVLVKENHITAAGGIEAALERVRAGNREALPVEVEVTTLEELERVLPFGVDRVLLDNMALPQLAAAVERVRRMPPPRPLLEASGTVSLSTVAAVARTGVDLISVGALTHSAPVADLSLLVDG